MADSLLNNIAVLIDADNAMVHSIPNVLRQIALSGRISLKRAYGNWTKDILSSWEPVLKAQAIHPMHQIDFVKNKNATDIAVVIDAMDLLHSGIYDGFAIVSSDSDFTPLAIRLKESGVKVIGCGGKNTPESLIQACDDFYRFESNGQLAENGAVAKKSKPSKEDIDGLHTLLKEAFDHYQTDAGYALLSNAGLFVRRARPDFDIRAYGVTGLAAFLENNPDIYELSYDYSSGVKVVSYRCK